MNCSGAQRTGSADERTCLSTHAAKMGAMNVPMNCTVRALRSPSRGILCWHSIERENRSAILAQNRENGENGVVPRKWKTGAPHSFGTTKRPTATVRVIPTMWYAPTATRVD